MTHRSNHRDASPTATSVRPGLRAGAVSISMIVTITGTGTTGHGMWTRAAS